MLRRLIFGLVLGLIVGCALAAGLVHLGAVNYLGAGGGALAYVSAALAGTLTGLLAGKPIWAADAKIEGALKAVFGALISVGAMFALRQWAGGIVVPSLEFVGAGGPGPVGELPAASLPLIAGVLGALFGLDNTDPPVKKEPAALPQRSRVAAAGKAAPKRPIEDAEDGDEVEVASKRAKR